MYDFGEYMHLLLNGAIRINADANLIALLVHSEGSGFK